MLKFKFGLLMVEDAVAGKVVLKFLNYSHDSRRVLLKFSDAGREVPFLVQELQN
jgi:hypothetical protein